MTIVAPPATGTAQVVNGTQIAFTPPADFLGTVMLDYQASNSIDSSTATLTINVTTGDGDFLQSGTNDPTLKPVAKALGDSCAMVTGAASTHTPDQADLLNICEQLTIDIQNGNNVDGAFGAIRNEELLAVNEIAASTARSTSRAIMDRLRTTRGGAGRGVDISGVQVRFGDQSVSSGDFAGILQHLQDRTAADTSEGIAGLPIGVFLSGEIVFGSRDFHQCRDWL